MKTMKKSYTPDPIEFFHGELMRQFHKWREEKRNGEISVEIDGIEMNRIIVEAKKVTKEKYEK